MSVLKSQRGESAVQFLDTARELEIYTIKQCAKFPKRYMFLITKDIVALASAVYNADCQNIARHNVFTTAVYFDRHGQSNYQAPPARYRKNAPQIVYFQTLA